MTTPLATKINSVIEKRENKYKFIINPYMLRNNPSVEQVSPLIKAVKDDEFTSKESDDFMKKLIKTYGVDITNIVHKTPI